MHQRVVILLLRIAGSHVTRERTLPSLEAAHFPRATRRHQGLGQSPILSAEVPSCQCCLFAQILAPTSRSSGRCPLIRLRNFRFLYEDHSMGIIPTIDQLTALFSNAIAPAFFLGAVAAFISLMSDRLSGVVARARLLNAIPADSDKAHIKVDIVRLKRRASLLRNGIFLSLCSGICSALLLGIIFATGFFGLRHAYGAGLLFIFANLLLCGALVRFAQDAAVDLNELDYVGTLTSRFAAGTSFRCEHGGRGWNSAACGFPGCRWRSVPPCSSAHRHPSPSFSWGRSIPGFWPASSISAQGSACHCFS